MTDTTETRNEPIIEFKSQEELEASSKEWQSRLFLDDWIIRPTLCAVHEMNSPDNCGECNAETVGQSAVIRILKKEYFPTDAITKYCAEQILVHELLHCKYLSYERDPMTIEADCFDNVQHALLEQMSKSLIMAKYNLPFEWFKNF